MERNEFKKALLNKVSEVSDINTEHLEMTLNLGQILGEFLDTIYQFTEKTTGFSLNYFKALRLLYVCFPNGVPISQVAEHVGITRTSMTQIINNLENQGLIKRVANPRDKRSSLVSLTAEGMEEVTVLVTKSHSALAHFADEAGIEKIQDAISILEELSLHLNNVTR
ncbi:MarR family winged helix-turn-helix transcriptional regulator [Halodesulfovibrio marinisediminis]|uniref:DNA-binding transcriptional regulator, MarR family n=1 Tax=Halodesulfovibrio marinisediminis DSM 17456 TaxID=1121457 RepID=A0A1N6FN01_9BACT|nr:MarR family transcriptional regulator [Halodesulfovibrio marinisediminis]SIN96661.1 DNA-binding transcriptional regulator, MarR family [Halodesulfovibrio marinisediminis DSM 17456]